MLCISYKRILFCQKIISLRNISIKYNLVSNLETKKMIIVISSISLQ